MVKCDLVIYGLIVYNKMQEEHGSMDAENLKI